LVPLVLVWCLLSLSHGETTLWKRSLQPPGSGKVLELLASEQGKSWAKIRSGRYIESVTPALRADEEALQRLAKSLLTELGAYDRSHPNNTISEATESYRLLVQAGNRLMDRGGYDNMVLADACFRIAVARLSYYLLNHPEAVGLIGNAIVMAKPEQLEPEFMNRLLAEEDQPIDVANLSKQSAFEKIFRKKAKEDPTKGESPGDFAHRWTSLRLLKEPNVRVLIRRLFDTYHAAGMILPGFVLILKKGGTIEDISRLDHPALVSLVGNSALRSLDADFWGEGLDADDLRRAYSDYRTTWQSCWLYRSTVGDESSE
jgi:hypothetical protein